MQTMDLKTRTPSSLNTLWDRLSRIVPGGPRSPVRAVPGSRVRTFVREELVRQFVLRELLAIRSRAVGLFLILWLSSDLFRPQWAVAVAILHIVTVLINHRSAKCVFEAVERKQDYTRKLRHLSIGMGATGFLWGALLWSFPIVETRTNAQFLVALTSIVAICLMMVAGALYPPAVRSSLIGASLGTLPIAIAIMPVVGPVLLVGFVILMGILLAFASVFLRQARRVALLHRQHIHLSRRLAKVNGALASSMEQLRILAERDSLTQMRNRGAFERAVDELKADGLPDDRYIVALLDIDHFKQVNDRFGHAAGDAVLEHFGEVLGIWERHGPARIAARWGGEEFIVAARIDHATRPSAVIEELRAILAPPGRNPGWPTGLRVSASIGYCTCGTDFDLQRETSRADGALYRAKNEGRDCYRLAA